MRSAFTLVSLGACLVAAATAGADADTCTNGVANSASGGCHTGGDSLLQVHTHTSHPKQEKKKSTDKQTHNSDEKITVKETKAEEKDDVQKKQTKAEEKDSVQKKHTKAEGKDDVQKKHMKAVEKDEVPKKDTKAEAKDERRKKHTKDQPVMQQHHQRNKHHEHHKRHQRHEGPEDKPVSYPVNKDGKRIYNGYAYDKDAILPPVQPATELDKDLPEDLPNNDDEGEDATQRHVESATVGYNDNERPSEYYDHWSVDRNYPVDSDGDKPAPKDEGWSLGAILAALAGCLLLILLIAGVCCMGGGSS